jgi:hypothetical protein
MAGTPGGDLATYTLTSCVSDEISARDEDVRPFPAATPPLAQAA